MSKSKSLNVLSESQKKEIRKMVREEVSIAVSKRLDASRDGNTIAYRNRLKAVLERMEERKKMKR